MTTYAETSPASTVGDTWWVFHNLHTKDVVVQVRRTSDGEVVTPKVIYDAVYEEASVGIQFSVDTLLDEYTAVVSA